MPGLELHPLTGERVADAAALLAERHARHRAAEPLLPELGDARAQVERELVQERATGAIAYRGGEAVAYVVGRVEEDAGIGSPRAVVDLAGCAAREPEAVRDVYAAVAQEWVDAGCLRHVAYVPASDDGLVDAWFRLAFGLQFATAVRETAPEEPVDAGVALRAGTRADLAALAGFDRLLWELQRLAPSFSGMDVESQDFEAEWADLWDEADRFPLHVVAERDGRAVGAALLYRRPVDALRVPDGNIDLAHAATLPEVRGGGVGLALTAHVLRWAHEQGYRSMTTDWRVVNLLSSRFWPRRGFRPTYYRLFRALP